MKFIILLFSGLFILCLNQNKTSFTGSTPAEKNIRVFLGIPLSDSVDFIRWKLTISDHHYEMDCQYGIGKPNSNGFIHNGERKTFGGNFRKEGNIYYFLKEKKVLKALEFNSDLLHFVDEQNNLLVGNGGWS